MNEPLHATRQDGELITPQETGTRMPEASASSRPHPARGRRVLYLLNGLGQAGWERDVSTICTHIDQQRWRPTIWTLTPGGVYIDAIERAGVHVHSLNRRRSYDPLFAFRTARAIARAEFDLIHTFLPAVSYYAAIAKAAFGMRTPLAFAEGTSALGHPWRRPALRWCLRRCDAYSANSPASSQLLQDLGVPANRIKIIPNGHDLSRFEAPLDRESVRRGLGVAPSDKLAIFVGRLISTKRAVDFLAALAQLRERQPSLKAVIVGYGPEMPALKAQTSAADLEGVVQFLGLRTDVPELLRSADLFVFPSEVEGLPNAVIEAALAGLPIVACNIEGVRAAVNHGREALLAPPRSAGALATFINQLLDQPEWGAEIGRAAQRRARESFAIDNVVTQLCDWYDELLQS